MESRTTNNQSNMVIKAFMILWISHKKWHLNDYAAYSPSPLKEAVSCDLTSLRYISMVNNHYYLHSFNSHLKIINVSKLTS